MLILSVSQKSILLEFQVIILLIAFNNFNFMYYEQIVERGTSSENNKSIFACTFF